MSLYMLLLLNYNSFDNRCKHNATLFLKKSIGVAVVVVVVDVVVVVAVVTLVIVAVVVLPAAVVSVRVALQ